jgi:nitroreductase
MDLVEALRTTGAVREFTDRPVPDEVVERVLESARFAPSGGNRQGWRVGVLRDPDVRRRLREVYQDGWYDYLAIASAGMVAFSPLNDRDAESRAVARGAAEQRARGEAGAERGGFAENLDRMPVVLVVLADLRALAAVDRDLPRYTFAGGASVYPFAWSVLLAGRAEGLAGVLTTVAVRHEAEVKELLRVPAELAVAGVLVLGYPVRQPTRLRRRPVPEFTTVDRFDGPAFGAS